MTEITLNVMSDEIASDFIQVAAIAGISILRSELHVEVLAAPHRPPSSLPSGKFGVYVFMFGGRCLKVGKAGPKSTARFCSQHYGAHAPSTLAKSLLKHQQNIGIDGLDLANVRAWICEHTARINFLLDARHGVMALSLLEAFVQCRLIPEFEGFANQRLSLVIERT
jgi:hypothetical protein